jgi:hypothetical protein
MDHQPVTTDELTLPLVQTYDYWHENGYKPFCNHQDARHIQFQVKDLNLFITMVLDYFSVAVTDVQRKKWISLISQRFTTLEARQHRFFLMFAKDELLSQEDYIRATSVFLQAKAHRKMCTAKKDHGLEVGLKYGGYLHLVGVLEDKFVKDFVLPEILGLVKGQAEKNFAALHNTGHQVESILVDMGADG